MAGPLAPVEPAGERLENGTRTLDVSDDESTRGLAAGLDVPVNNAASYADRTGMASTAGLENAARVLDTNPEGYHTPVI